MKIAITGHSAGIGRALADKTTTEEGTVEAIVTIK